MGGGGGRRRRHIASVRAAGDWIREIRHDKPFNVRTARIAVFAGSLALYLALGALRARAIGPGATSRTT